MASNSGPHLQLPQQHYSYDSLRNRIAAQAVPQKPSDALY